MRQQQLVRSILGIFHLLFAPLLRALCSSLTSKHRTASPSSKNFPRLPPPRFRNTPCEVNRPLSRRSRRIQHSKLASCLHTTGNAINLRAEPLQIFRPSAFYFASAPWEHFLFE